MRTPSRFWPRFLAVSDPRPVAPGGLLDRRAVLKGLAAMSAVSAVPARAEDDARLAAAMPWQKTAGKPMSGYGTPSSHEGHVLRTTYTRYGAIALGNGGSFTPLHQLEGTITPSGLHFERHHHGVPDIDPARHRLVLHGLVDRPLEFRVEDLLRYPMESRVLFIECSGNSFRNTLGKPAQVSCGEIHGLVSNSEWTGIPLSMLLDESGVQAAARWVIAEGADAATMARSIPLEKALDDTLVALYQNGERLRPEQGYPLRLVLPGFEGNMCVKWLHRLKLADGPQHSRDETSHYTDLLPDGRALQFTFEMGVKSVITQPSAGRSLPGPGYYDIAGFAWSGAGRVRTVEVSADAGRTWVPAALTGDASSHTLVRFRIPWHWDGQPATLMSRATDERGQGQPTRSEWLARYGANQRYHCNAIQAWAVDDMGEIANVFV